MAADQTFASQLGTLIQLLHRAAKGDSGYAQAVRDAASALARGHRVELERGADVVDHTSKRATQHKELTSKRSDEVITKMKDAAEQLRGEKGEMPPGGYERVVDIRVVNEANPLYRAGPARWLHELNRASKMHGVDAVRVTNAEGMLYFRSSRANGRFEQVPMLPVTTAPDREDR